MKHSVELTNFTPKNIYPLGKDFSGKNPEGEEISFTNYYMEKNGTPFFGISGEIHFSRMHESMWEDAIAKMKSGGINVIVTYLFWIHHEEEEGIFDFTGRRDIRTFVKLCQKYDMYVILRVGPFDHGEVRNGGIPDWMYGMPFEVRQLNQGFLFYTKRLYTKFAEQVEGLYFKDGGPIIGTQIDNEYMHSSAPWEITTGISDEWVFGGNEGDTYMLELKKLAAECGLIPVFYTCTGWGNAATPDCMLPLWGGYAYQPWLFYSHSGEHPSTKEYLYQDLHNNRIPKSYNFEPNYLPEGRPYACCEMGGGMACSYYYRFVLPYKSVDAMANIKIASGCNFLGYYVFHGGSNPVGKHGAFLNEGQMPKISYDYQAALGEFGQMRESYSRLKTIHTFLNTYGKLLCTYKTILPEGASDIEPKDLSTLRFALRTNGHGGFLFLNNFQDHETMPAKKQESVEIILEKETVCFENISIAGDENCILPFHFDMHGINLVSATAQPITHMETAHEILYLFMRPEGMESKFVFEKDALAGGSDNSYTVNSSLDADTFSVSKNGLTIKVICISRALADKLYILEKKGFLFAEGAVMEKGNGIFLETTAHKEKLYTIPHNLLADSPHVTMLPAEKEFTGFGIYEISTPEVIVTPVMEKVAMHRYTFTFPQNFMAKTKDILLRISYRGDIGHAFIKGNMINDNFCNGAPWEIGLRTFSDKLAEYPLTVYITPLKKGASVNVESSMAARRELVQEEVGEIDEAETVPVYEMQIL